jgi:uncharacterized membrane protein YeaQ/YmgE (transglycosylase-associated protein family)
MNILIWLIMGGVIGWLASVIMRTQEGILLNIVVGIVGALIGGWLISPMVGAATINQGDLSLAGLGVSLLGASCWRSSTCSGAAVHGYDSQLAKMAEGHFRGIGAKPASAPGKRRDFCPVGQPIGTRPACQPAGT